MEYPQSPRPPAANVNLARRCVRALLALLGWHVDVAPPPSPKCVIVVYPHTSNWDFVVGYLAKVAVGLPVSWVGKHSLFRWPIAGLLRRMGGVPLIRSASSGFVTHLAEEFAQRPRMWLAIAPEGTRSRTDCWKSGFYRLALATGAPVGLAFIDYTSHRVGLTTYLYLTGDKELDLGRIRSAYAGKVGKYPGRASEIRFRS